MTADGTYEACLAYVNSKGHVLWGDFMLVPDSDRNTEAARWLEKQVRGVADHYDTADHPAPPYAGPYSTERNGGGRRPSALITHGQQAETW